MLRSFHKAIVLVGIVVPSRLIVGSERLANVAGTEEVLHVDARQSIQLRHFEGNLSITVVIPERHRRLVTIGGFPLLKRKIGDAVGRVGEHSPVRVVQGGGNKACPMLHYR